MAHRHSPLNLEVRRRIVQRCQSRPITLVAADVGISRACASKWVNRWRRYGDLGLQDRPCAPRHSPNATPDAVGRGSRRGATSGPRPGSLTNSPSAVSA